MARWKPLIVVLVILGGILLVWGLWPREPEPQVADPTSPEAAETSIDARTDAVQPVAPGDEPAD